MFMTLPCNPYWPYAFNWKICANAKHGTIKHSSMEGGCRGCAQFWVQWHICFCDMKSRTMLCNFYKELSIPIFGVEKYGNKRTIYSGYFKNLKELVGGSWKNQWRTGGSIAVIWLNFPIFRRTVVIYQDWFFDFWEPWFWHLRTPW
jgi:hypothetical protein